MNPPKPTNTTQLGHLSLASKPDALIEVEQLLEEIHNEFNFKDDAYGNIMVAVTEAVNNAIQHGNKNDSNKKVELSIYLDGFRLLVSVTDQGAGFDEASLPDPTAPENLEKLGGRGVFLMKHLADDLIFNEQGRQVTMAFNI